jgi:pyruvate,orthophosphate dikinase
MTEPRKTLTAELLPLLRIKGFAKAEHLAEALGRDADELAAALAALVETGDASSSALGHKLTPEGAAKADAQLAAERESADPAQVDALHERFGPVNRAFKTLMNDWQVKTVDGQQVPNDHADEAYDRAVLDRLERVHDDLAGILSGLVAEAPRFERYPERFDRALQRVRQGEHRYLGAPLIDSYHTVWFELHEDLIRLAGRNRADEAAAGRAV